MDLISVIIPTFNSERYIQKAINSVLNQSYKNIEIIVVDDGSTDNTKNILKKYLNDILVIHQENNGPSKARNRGIKEAKGKYIAFLDSDDEWFPDKLQEQINLLMKSPDTHLVLCSGIIIDENDNFIKNFDIEKFSPEILLKKMLFNNCIKTPSTWLIKKTCFDFVGYFDENLKVAEDWELSIRICTKFKYNVIQKPLFKYRLCKGSQSYFAEKNLENEIIFLKKIINLYYKNISISQKNKAYSFRYRAAAIAFRENKKRLKTFFCLLKCILLYPQHIFTKIFFGILKYCIMGN